MRPEPASPAAIVLDLLAQADALAVLASDAILAGDDGRLSEIVEVRGHVISAALDAWREAGVQVPPDDVRRLQTAARETIRLADMVTATGRTARDEIVAALSALDARQAAGHEYQAPGARGSINVVL